MLVEFRDGSKFLSTPSARRATAVATGTDPIPWISIHALREEGDNSAEAAKNRAWQISIHALREEGDPGERAAGTYRENFYPRPPRGG